MEDKPTWVPSGIRSLLGRFAIDLRSLAACRIALAAMLLVDACTRFQYAREHYTDFGAYPLEALKEEWGGQFNWMLTPFALEGSVEWAQGLFVLYGAAAFLLLIGWQSRFAMFLCWLMIVGIHNRNFIVLHGGDQMVRIFSFWMMFLPVGARWSVDAAFSKIRAYGRSVPDQTLSMGSAALLLQGAIVYFATAGLKHGKEWLSDGSALWYALQIDQFTTTYGRWVRMLPLPVLQLMTWSTMAIEIGGPIVAFFGNARVRIVTVLFFFFFHLILISGMMDVGPISFNSCLWWIPYLPGSVWDWIGERIRRSPLRAPIDAVCIPLRHAHDARVRRWVEQRRPLPAIHPSVPMQFCAAVVLLFVIQWNVHSVLGKRAPGSRVANWIRQDQNWGMFAPRPLIEDGWFVVAARLSDGSTVDLFRNGKPADFAKPAYIPADYWNVRWGKHWMNLWEQKNAPYRRYMAEWLLRKWNREHPTRQIQILTMWFVLERTPKPGQPNTQPTPVALWSQTASGFPAAPVSPPAP